MAFPDSRLPVRIRIAPGGAPAADPGDWLWTDVTDDWRYAPKIVINEGRGDWGDKVDPGSCALTFDNTSGDYSEYNPNGQWYGLLGRNTPLMVDLLRASDAWPRTSSSGWGTADLGGAWTDAGSGGSVLGTDWTVGSGVGTHSVPAASAYRLSWLPGVSLLDVEVQVTVDMVITDVLTAAVEPANILLRMQSTSDYYMARVSVSAAEAVTVSLYHSTGGLLATAAAAGLVFAGQPLTVRAWIQGERLAMKVWDPAGAEPSGWQVTATDDTITTPGGVGIRSGVAAGNTNTKPVLFAYDDLTVHAPIFGGFVPAWVPRWDKSANDRTVSVVARGTLYRLQPGTGKARPASPMRRSVLSAENTGLLGYWPCEDGTDSTGAASAISGLPAMTAIGTVTFAAFDPSVSTGGTYRYASDPLPDFSAGGGLVGGAANPGVTSPVAWTMQFAAEEVNGPSTPGPMVVLAWQAGDLFIEVLFTGPASFNTAVRVNGTIVIEDSVTIAAFLEWRVQAVQVGANVTLQLILLGQTFGNVTPGGAAPYTATITGKTLGWPTNIGINPSAAVTSPAQHLIGQVQVWDGIAAPYMDPGGVDTSWSADFFELAHDRIARLTAEDGIDCSVPAVDSGGIEMTSQVTATALDLYRQCEEADVGVLYERPFALAYAPRSSLYNQTPALTLDAQDDLAEAPEPDPAAQSYRNRWTVKRAGGSEAVAESDDIAAGALVNEESAEVVTYWDNTLADQAGWRLHLTSDTALRWPRLQLNLAARPELIDAWLNVRVGSRILATNPPADVAGQDIDILYQGGTITLGLTDFDVEANCSPARPWDVAEADGDQRVPADGSALGGSLTDSATSFTVTSTATNGLWFVGSTGTDPDDFPLDLNVGGERIRVSQIAGASSPQTFTVDTGGRSVNGVVKAHAAGTGVDVWSPAICPL